MVQLFEDQRRDEPAWRVCARSLLDLAITLPAQHLEVHVRRSPAAVVSTMYLTIAAAGVALATVGGTSRTSLLIGLVMAFGGGFLGIAARRAPHPRDAAQCARTGGSSSSPAPCSSARSSSPQNSASKPGSSASRRSSWRWPCSSPASSSASLTCSTGEQDSLPHDQRDAASTSLVAEDHDEPVPGTPSQLCSDTKLTVKATADVSERPFVLPPRGVGEWHRLIRASDAEGGGQGSGRRLSWPWAGDRRR